MLLPNGEIREGEHHRGTPHHLHGCEYPHRQRLRVEQTIGPTSALLPRELGNLIIGYDEPPGGLSATDRGGSQNPAIEVGHRFTSAAFGGIVGGADNTIDNL